MEIGNKVKIKECHKIPALVGEDAIIVSMMDQELSPYPITVKISSGEYIGKFCGFREDELELVPDIPKVFLEE